MSLADGRYDLLETMAFDPLEGIRLLELHLARLKASADALGFAFDRHGVRNELQAATFRLRDHSRVRLMVSRGGAVAIEVRDRIAWPGAIVPVKVVPRHAPADDLRLLHKTTDRSLYRDALQRGGTYEVALIDAQGYLTECCFSSIFVERGDKLLTPPRSRGLLPGILRQSLIDMGEAVEADLRPHDLDDGFFIGNAARGMVAATLAH
ncbi:MAG: aminotransferase [Sphingobium sp.]|jgi:4-amino-4-deoxychorismate lyase|uniref:Probable branched-chain-amino-acid aminotransferase n=1 Tax=Sphingobium xenophagum TaxID=121428 RepID=A0A401IYG3_SPHXE|nr:MULTISPECIES: aminotransferase class IV [Sphingobium]MBU0660328.1 aminotransferase class IV [Alphaproteobacteria bacterium]MBG6119185.1 4-amino-4-deoxychorismate lyase/para-aminobenzoate synthetase/4-amino-4-deoxychorismate lyase [Sphingobium sp. JAI105]MBU1462225.1 aminotransferase class IV [Alphaproteobacteria bacterium]PSO09645.1 aminotransferase [Sphingobium sp. AEW4]TAJ74425.1 MAG: aminotransferase [Sphingobium sp.]